MKHFSRIAKTALMLMMIGMFSAAAHAVDLKQLEKQSRSDVFKLLNSFFGKTAPVDIQTYKLTSLQGKKATGYVTFICKQKTLTRDVTVTITKETLLHYYYETEIYTPYEKSKNYIREDALFIYKFLFSDDKKLRDARITKIIIVNNMTLKYKVTEEDESATLTVKITREKDGTASYECTEIE